MNYKVISPEQIKCEVQLPASKSISNRALILNALSGSLATINNIAKCDDTDAMVAALASTASTVNIGAAGTAMRFLTAYFAMKCGNIVTLDGSERMRQRPIKVLVDALRSCGADITYALNEGVPPLLIKGKTLISSEIELTGNISSQYISALLMIAPCIKGGLTIKLVGNVISLPYIEMTLALMRQYGVDSIVEGNIITIPEKEYRPLSFEVESDWSAASYWYELQALLPNSEIRLKGLYKDSVQGDATVSNYFALLGVATEYESDGVILSTNINAPKINFLELNLINQPDLAQTIVVTACLLNIPFHISGLATLKIKETDRIEALRTQLLKLGYVIAVNDDYSLLWNGETVDVKSSPVIATFEDHRMAMAFAPASIAHNGIEIADIDVVSKSYPQYWNHLHLAGFKLTKA